MMTSDDVIKKNLIFENKDIREYFIVQNYQYHWKFNGIDNFLL
jgi:hypothetical protein